MVYIDLIIILKAVSVFVLCTKTVLFCFIMYIYILYILWGQFKLTWARTKWNRASSNSPGPEQNGTGPVQTHLSQNKMEPGQLKNNNLGQFMFLLISDTAVICKHA